MWSSILALSLSAYATLHLHCSELSTIVSTVLPGNITAACAHAAAMTAAEQQLGRCPTHTMFAERLQADFQFWLWYPTV